MKPLVSIITPARGAAATIDRTLDSVARQSIVHWQHVIAAPATDIATRGRIADRNDARIRLIDAGGGTAGAARNAALAEATGDWILFLDADDTVPPAHLRNMLAFARKRRAEIVLCGYRRLNGEGRAIGRYAPPRFGDDVMTAIRQGPPTAIHGLLARRERIAAVGGFDPALVTNEDWDLWLRLGKRTDEWAVARGMWVDYWTSTGSLSRDAGAMARDIRAIADRHADPHAPEATDRLLVKSLLWCAASAIAQHQPIRPILDLLPDMIDLWDRRPMVDALLDGLAVGCAAPPSDLAARWDTLAPGLAALRDRLAPHAIPAGGADALLRMLERDIARVSGATGMIGATHVTRLSIGHRAETPPGATHALLRVPFVRPRRWGLIDRDPAIAAQQGTGMRSTAATDFADVASRLGPLADGAATALALARRTLRPDPRRDKEDPTRDIGTPLFNDDAVATWDAVFGDEDPWDYGNPYEQLKYEQTLEILPHGTIDRAIELACAEGMFTCPLAKRVGSLVAADISAVALGRAEARCRDNGVGNVSFEQIDFFNSAFGAGWNLICASEVLYYMPDAETVRGFARRIAAALAPGGVFVHAHAHQVSDDPARTGFDWGDTLAASALSRLFGEEQALVRMRGFDTPLYRIELYGRAVDGHRPATILEPRPFTADLPPALAADVVWNGVVRSRSDAARERTHKLPVLMYHRIAEDGPAALAPYRTAPEAFEHQLRFLRRRGFASVTLEQWDEARRRSASFRGRPVLLTFDDAYADFDEAAWPALERNGFSAHVFVVTGHAGGHAAWDAPFGPAAPLMRADRIRALADRGVGFGSHLVSHRAADTMGSAALRTELRESRAWLEDLLGKPVRSIALPYGVSSRRVEALAREEGYTHLFLAGGGAARVWGPRLRIPRVEVAGGDSIETFAEKIGAREPPQPEDLPCTP